MVKTIRGLLSLDELRKLLTEHCRKAPEYLRVSTETFEVFFYEDKIRLVLKEPKEGKCYYCGGTGRTDDGSKCWVCKGTGVEKSYQTIVSAKITEYKEYPHYGTLKIEVDTQGTNPEVWKPDVQKIKNFIEALAEKRCIIVPQKGAKKPKQQIMPISDISQKDLSSFFGGKTDD